MGPIHGVLFIFYVLLTFQLRTPLAWSRRTLVIILADALIPAGGFFAASRSDLRSARAFSSESNVQASRLD